MDYIRQFDFVYPWVLTGIPLLIVAAWWYFKKFNHQISLIILPTADNPKAPETLKSRMYPYLPVMIWTALMFMTIALARPRLPLKEEKIKTEGIDIMMVMDLSTSMLAKDFQPNRMEACKEIAIDFVEKRNNDRIGVIIFAGEAYTLCPATTDHAVVKNLLSQIQIGILEDKTAIGMGLATAVNRLKDIESKSKVIILLTDGENNTGYIDPKTATELAKTYNIKIYSIAVGTIGVALMPSNIFGSGNDIPVQVSIDTELLKYIASETNGKFYRATDNESLQKIYEEIDTLEKTEIELNLYKRYAEAFPLFIRIAFGLMVLFWVLKSTVFKSLN
ncbi:MAG: VWA domain-containing protein [Saprospiraceae bacterium]|nr:VWA domain-containing protein [Saprospiraceae bacterium]